MKTVVFLTNMLNAQSSATLRLRVSLLINLICFAFVYHCSEFFKLSDVMLNEAANIFYWFYITFCRCIFHSISRNCFFIY